MLIDRNARVALRRAYANAPSVVGYIQGQGWIIYLPTEGAPEGVIPEMFVARTGTLPVALSDDGAAVWASIIQDAMAGE